MSKDILDQADHHFFHAGMKFEYGRPDESSANKTSDGKHGTTDSSRTEQDNDHDGYRGVDCSSFVWRGLKNAGYDVGNSPFGTSSLFEGQHITDYSKKHFDVIPGAEASQRHGQLQPGDIIMFKKHPGHGQHVAIFKDYDAHGNIEFIGSQTSTGPAKVTMTPGQYWEKNWEIVGALRAKPEFKTHEAQPLDGKAVPVPVPEPAAAKPATHAEPHATHAAPHAAPHPAAANPAPHTASAPADVMRQGDKTDAVKAAQERLSHLGYKDERGHALVADGDFGKHTKHAVEQFQKDHGLQADGVVGKHTLDAMKTAHVKAPGIDEAGHPGNPLYKQAQAAVHAVDAKQGRTPDAASDRLAAATAVSAHANGLSRVDHVVLSGDGSKAFAVQGDLNSPFKQLAEVNTQHAVSTSIEQSSQQWKQASEQQQASTQNQAQQQARTQQPATPGAP
jgi:peptidoglycan hydrolase-like protein with peptidoglycan-binding domain